MRKREWQRYVQQKRRPLGPFRGPFLSGFHGPWRLTFFNLFFFFFCFFSVPEIDFCGEIFLVGG